MSIVINGVTYSNIPALEVENFRIAGVPQGTWGLMQNNVTPLQLITISVPGTFVDCNQSTDVDSNSVNFSSSAAGVIQYDGEEDFECLVISFVNCDSAGGITVGGELKLVKNASTDVKATYGAYALSPEAQQFGGFTTTTLSNGDTLKHQITNLSNTSDINQMSIYMLIIPIPG